MTPASDAAVEAVMRELGCEEVDHHERPFCATEHHADEPWFRERWGRRGCEYAARAADAAVGADAPRLKAEAWDEGFNAGERDVFEHEDLGDWESECIRNPYRAAAERDGQEQP
jgi:hypothetical protein